MMCFYLTNHTKARWSGFDPHATTDKETKGRTERGPEARVQWHSLLILALRKQRQDLASTMPANLTT